MMYQVTKSGDSWKVTPLPQWCDDPEICLGIYRIAPGCHYCFVCFPGLTEDPDYLIAEALIKGMQFIKNKLTFSNFWRDELGRVKL